jgi:hypothetical protein
LLHFEDVDITDVGSVTDGVLQVVLEVKEEMNFDVNDAECASEDVCPAPPWISYAM